MSKVHYEDLSEEYTSQFNAHDERDLILRNYRTELRYAKQNALLLAELTLARQQVHGLVRENQYLGTVLDLQNDVLETVYDFTEKWTSTEYPVSSRNRSVQIQVNQLITDMQLATVSIYDDDDEDEDDQYVRETHDEEVAEELASV